MTMQQKLNTVLNVFKSGRQILVITKNNNLILSNALHCEMQLINYLKLALQVRII